MCGGASLYTRRYSRCTLVTDSNLASHRTHWTFLCTVTFRLAWADLLLRSSWCCVITCVCTPWNIILRKRGQFSFYLVKISHLYLVLLLSCDRSGVHHDFTDTLYIDQWEKMQLFQCMATLSLWLLICVALGERTCTISHCACKMHQLSPCSTVCYLLQMAN